MINKHATDIEIQEYVFQKVHCDVDTAEHIDACAYCTKKAMQYSMLFKEIEEQEKPAFDFELADLVTDHIQQVQRMPSHDRPFYWLIIFTTVVFGCIIFYFFGVNILNLFRGINSMLTVLIITTIASILLFLLIDMNRKYHKQLSALNYY